jgi:hypothetical protein
LFCGRLAADFCVTYGPAARYILYRPRRHPSCGRSWASAALSRKEDKRQMGSLANILWTVVVILVVLWLLGFLLKIGGDLIHLLLVIAVIVILYNLFTGRRGV